VVVAERWLTTYKTIGSIRISRKNVNIKSLWSKMVSELIIYKYRQLCQ